MRRLLAVVAGAAVMTGSLGSAIPVEAAFPGANGDIVFVSEEPGKPVIARMTLNGTDIHLLTQAAQSPTALGDQWPRWSPGGGFIVFTRYYSQTNGDIWVMNADGTGQKRLTNTSTDDDAAAFSADGSRIVFSSNRHGNYEIYSMKLDGSDVRRLTTNAATDYGPAWSPNNNRIAFSSNRRGVYEIFTMNPDGSAVARETTGSEFGDRQPAWSADGAYIYYSASRSEEEGYGDIVRVNVATNEVDQVDYGESDQLSPAPAPDPSTEYEMAHVQFDLYGTFQYDIYEGTYPLTGNYSHSAYMPDWQPIPAFPLVDARFSSFEADIEWAYGAGITTGCSAERYCVTDPVTRGQMATFLARALHLPEAQFDYFDDDDGTTHEENTNRIFEAGITTGCGPSLYCPDGLVTREQMASFLARAFDLPATATDYFTDDETSSHEANINRIRAAGITTGCSATTYCPKGLVTRGQMAAFLHRAVE